MNVTVVRIGNSRGIRIPRKVLDQCHIDSQVDLSVKGERIVLTAVKNGPRQGWAEAARKMRECGDDELLVPDVFPEEDALEW